MPTGQHNHDGRTHYHGDGCDDDHGRTHVQHQHDVDTAIIDLYYLVGRAVVHDGTRSAHVVDRSDVIDHCRYLVALDNARIQRARDRQLAARLDQLPVVDDALDTAGRNPPRNPVT